ncbi:metallophosphoesterase family protein [Companilactobacillus nantensis]|uniref:Metallophosphoesterase n=1 Tax=Companilactobacillus nantensis DSM 16982 TaxID=1423774 RepID=A0A0R1WKI6_9LACO|nr:metallophosphoesterase [Companilactobacillus nantensis]KRM18490.1 metallophosphoesterase [Companilactobacillus nantensis DSM 16982]GEO63063.1 3',5'-cyclic-nucleotide phosphodiesterase [Companilactobacillus nantensis]
MSKYKIIQITDTHLTPNGAAMANNQKVDPYVKLDNIFLDVAKMPVKPDLIAITGDLIHEGTAEDYDRLYQIIDHYHEMLNIPIQVVLGNHDRTAEFFEGYLKQIPREKYYYLLETEETNLYFLDSKFYNYEQGYIGQEQLDWLQDNLRNNSKQSVIFLHHPIDGPAMHHMRYSILQESEQLMRTIKNSPVKAVFSGHIHFETSFVKDGILLHSTDSSAYHIDCDDEHRHLIYDATYYDIITIADGEIGTETRCLYEGQDIINHVDVIDTDFVNEDIFD